MDQPLTNIDGKAGALRHFRYFDYVMTAFVAILVGGAAGALIGASFADLQCTEGSCDLSRGLWLWGCSILGALGVAVVAVLTLRALGEWSTRSRRVS